MDVYRGELEADDSVLDVFLYISFFPQLVAGPIVRAAHFLPQLRQAPKLDRAMVTLGIVLILIGLFKKMVIANYLATELVDKRGALAKVAAIIAEHDANIENIHFKDRDGLSTHIRFTLTVRSRKHLANIIRSLRNRSVVMRVRRA